MKKETIEIYRHKKHLKGYGIFLNSEHEDYKILKSNGEPSDGLIMAAIIEFSKDKSITIYSHDLRREEVAVMGYGTFESENSKIKVPYCDLVYYLDIYYQEK